MLKSIEGIYINGNIELEEMPKNIPPNTKVIVTFILNSEIQEVKNQDLSISPPDHDLDYLAGTWTEEDEKEFLINTDQFNQIDQNLGD